MSNKVGSFDIIKLNFKLNLIEYSIVYFIKTFIIWEFKNPFKWIMDIPTASPDVRAVILILVVSWQLIQLIVISIWLLDEEIIQNLKK